MSYNHLLDTLNAFLKEADAEGMKDLKTLNISLDQVIQMVGQYREFQKLTLTDIQKLQQKHNILGSDQQAKESTVSSLLSAFLPFRNMHQEEYQKFRIDLELQISDSYYALKEHAKVLQALDKEAVNRIMKTLDESYQKHHSFTDITVIAFSRFTQSQAARNTALICFLIASLVDVISAILPFSGSIVTTQHCMAEKNTAGIRKKNCWNSCIMLRLHSFRYSTRTFESMYVRFSPI